MSVPIKDLSEEIDEFNISTDLLRDTSNGQSMDAQNHTPITQKQTQNQNQIAPITQVVIAEPAPQPVESLAPASMGSAFVLILFAMVLSMLVRRLGKIPTAHTLRRWLPVIYVSIWMMTTIGITSIYTKGISQTWRLVIWGALVAVVFASVGWLRSVMSGVALAIEGRIREGDTIRLSEVEGEVSNFGLRSVQVRSVDGTIHEIPNDKFVTESVTNLSGDSSDAACEIITKIPTAINPNTALEFARQVAILTPLASPRHKPEVFLRSPSGPDEPYELLIRGYAFDNAYQSHFASDVVSRLHDAWASDS